MIADLSPHLYARLSRVVLTYYSKMELDKLWVSSTVVL
jgi:hypothetical protein